jgi:transposase
VESGIYLTAPLLPKRRPKCKLAYHRVFNLILSVLYTGMQWKCLPVLKASDGKAEIHYTTVDKVFARWSDDASLEHAFIASVRHLSDHHQLDLSILHGGGTNTVTKKGGDGIGYSGHKHQKGEKVIASIDNNGYVLAPLPVAPVNHADTVLFPEGLNALRPRPYGSELSGHSRGRTNASGCCCVSSTSSVGTPR